MCKFSMMIRTTLIVMIILASFWCAAIHSASIHTEEFSDKLQNLVEKSALRGIRIERASNPVGKESSKRFCYNTPCGWEVYKPFTRRHEYFMKNTCVCPDSTYKCVRTDDDLSVSAYVYRCRQNTTADDIVEPVENVN